MKMKSCDNNNKMDVVCNLSLGHLHELKSLIIIYCAHMYIVHLI